MKYLAGLIVCSGCSLLYNPSNLPSAVDAAPDAEIILDADPTQLALERASPLVVVEGQGTGGARAAVVVVHGKHLVAGAKIELALHGGGAVPGVTVGETEVAANGFMAAAPVTIAVDPALASGETVRLDVVVTQPGPLGPVVVTLASGSPTEDVAALAIRGLDELAGANVSLPSGLHEYSHVAITGNLTAADGNAPLVIRSQSSITIAGTTKVSATGQLPGPGAAAGGAGGVGVLGAPGAPGAGPGGGLTAGGGGGFVTRGGDGAAVNTGGPIAGLPSVPSFETTRASGGAGGNGGLLGAVGGVGGGGGGTIELTAAGTVSLGPIESRGGNGASGATLGGGGTGGVVLVRAAVSLEAGTIDLAGGTGAGAGSIGRLRTDAPQLAAPVAYRGPTFATTTPLITRTETPELTLFGEALRPFRYFIVDERATSIRGPIEITTSNAAQNTFTLGEPLFRGLNTICALVEDAVINDERPEARNCVQVVYLYTP